MKRGNTLLTRYRVIVMSVKPKRFHVPDDEFITMVMEGDTFYGYSYPEHREGKFFDLWFTQNKELDSQNLLSFNRILSIQSAATIGGMLPTAKLYHTKLGTFVVEEVGLATVDQEFYGVDYENQFS